MDHRTALGVGVAAMLTTAAGCSSESKVGQEMAEVERVRFIVPIGFRGVFVLTDDPAVSPERRDGVWVYRIPRSGSLRIARNGPWQKLHDISAEYEDKEPLAVGSSSPVPPFDDKAVKLRPLLHGGGRHSYLVGTEAEQDEILKRPNSLKRD